ncbi:MAG: tyrosine-type recombinase/integrase [Candidatus Dormibacteria bacterium]
MPQPAVRGRKMPAQLDKVTNASGIRTTWDDAVEAFLREKRRMGLSASTLELYRSLLAGPRTRTYLADTGITTASGLTEQALRDFESELQDSGLSEGSVHQYHATLKNFARFCLSRKLADDPGVLEVKAPKQAQRAPGVINREEETKLIAAALKPRDKFIIRFLMGTGLRRAELLALTVDDIVAGPDGDYVHVRLGKGRKDRMVPLDSRKMGTALTKATRDYISRDRPESPGSRALLLTHVRDAGDYQPLSASGLRSILRRLEKDTGIECNPHRFRHSYGTRAIQAGVPAFAVQRLLGHTTLDMVSEYVHYDDVSLMDAVN